jgi:hypothetical protein
MKSQTGAMSVESNLTLMEKSREAYWRKYRWTTSIKLRWRAVTVRHCFHALPGETILDPKQGVDFGRRSCQKFCRAEILLSGLFSILIS